MSAQAPALVTWVHPAVSILPETIGVSAAQVLRESHDTNVEVRLRLLHVFVLLYLSLDLFLCFIFFFFFLLWGGGGCLHIQPFRLYSCTANRVDKEQAEYFLCSSIFSSSFSSYGHNCWYFH